MTPNKAELVRDAEVFAISPSIVRDIETLALWLLLIVFAGAFAAQVATRVRLIAAGSGSFRVDNLGFRARQFLVDAVLQRKTIRERPAVGIAHALVFWGFVAFAGYTTIEFLYGLRLVDFTRTWWFQAYRLALVPFASGVLLGVTFLLIRRVLVRSVGLGDKPSLESVVVALLIATLMITFLLGVRLEDESTVGRVNWWVHMLAILVFLPVIPASKHFHLVLSPISVFLKSPELGRVPNLDFDKEEVGLEVVKDLTKKNVLDAFTCVECGRCQVNCPAWDSGKELNPKTLILQTRDALAGERDTNLAEIYSEKVLWQCTTCGACEHQCPVGIEHVPLIIGARRGMVSNGAAPEYLGGMYHGLARRRNIWGLDYDQRQKFVDIANLEMFDPARHEWLVWLGCAGAFEADFQKALRSLFEILRICGVTFGVLARERCNGDPAKRTGNEYMFQELANENIEELKTGGAKKILTSCPHCLKTLGEDYARCGYKAEVVHSAVFVSELTRNLVRTNQPDEAVTFHDPCYLGRYAGHVDQPRQLLTRFGGEIKEPVRNRENPFCCGAGGGLLFEHEEPPGSRIGNVRFKQLQDTGAGTVVTACPFCTIMLKGAGASAQADTLVVDLMTFVRDRL